MPSNSSWRGGESDRCAPPRPPYDLLLHLDLERIRRNLANAITPLVNDEELLRELAKRGVWRHSDEWWGATEAALGHFREGEVLQKRSPGEGVAGA